MVLNTLKVTNMDEDVSVISKRAEGNLYQAKTKGEILQFTILGLEIAEMSSIL